MTATAELKTNPPFLNTLPARLNSAFQLRPWQHDFVATTVKAIANGKKAISGEITTGAGKTYAALAAYIMGVAPQTKRPLFIALSPRSNISQGWVRSALSLGMHLTDGCPDDLARKVESGQLHGFAATYQWLSRNAARVAALCSEFDVTVVRDEADWLSDTNSWGPIFAAATEHAFFSIGVTATPFRREPEDRLIAFDYLADEAVVDFAYEYEQGRADHINPRLNWAAVGGALQWERLNGSKPETVEMTFDEYNERKPDGDYKYRAKIDERLRVAVTIREGLLNPFAEGMIEQGIDALREMRRLDGRTGGIVFAKDCAAAKEIARLLRAMGEGAVVVDSTMPDSDEKIDSFRSGTTAWIVSVGMLAVGTDIPRLRVSIYLTNVTSTRLFLQYAGRLLRLDPQLQWGAQDTLMIVPADPRLMAILERFGRRVERLRKKKKGVGGGGGGPRKVLLSIAADDVDVTFHGSVASEIRATSDVKSLRVYERLEPLFKALAPNFDLAGSPAASLYRLNMLEHEIAANAKVKAISTPVQFLRERAWVADTLQGLGLGTIDARAIGCAMLRHGSEAAAKVAHGRRYGFTTDI